MHRAPATMLGRACAMAIAAVLTACGGGVGEIEEVIQRFDWPPTYHVGNAIKNMYLTPATYVARSKASGDTPVLEMQLRVEPETQSHYYEGLLKLGVDGSVLTETFREAASGTAVGAPSVMDYRLSYVYNSKSPATPVVQGGTMEGHHLRNLYSGLYYGGQVGDNSVLEELELREGSTRGTLLGYAVLSWSLEAYDKNEHAEKAWFCHVQHLLDTDRITVLVERKRCFLTNTQGDLLGPFKATYTGQKTTSFVGSRA